MGTAQVLASPSGASPGRLPPKGSMSTLNDAPAAPLDEAQLDALFEGAHTAESFADREVPEEVLRRLQELTRMPPSAMNSQPLRILWVRSPEARAELVSHMGGNNKAKTLAAPLTAVLASSDRWHCHLPTLAPFRVKDMDSLEENEPMRRGLAHTSARIQAGYFLLAARALGLDVGPMGGFKQGEVDQAFFSENGWESFLVVNLGYPAPDGAGYRPRQGRLNFEEQTLTV